MLAYFSFAVGFLVGFGIGWLFAIVAEKIKKLEH
jgi:hypothetical protein